MTPTMRARSADTDSEAEEAQLALLRQAGIGRRARMALSLSGQVIGLARQAIRRTLPDPSEEQTSLRFVELHYGPDLEAGLRLFLASRRA